MIFKIYGCLGTPTWVPRRGARNYSDSPMFLRSVALMVPTGHHRVLLQRTISAVTTTVIMMAPIVPVLKTSAPTMDAAGIATQSRGGKPLNHGFVGGLSQFMDKSSFGWDTHIIL